MAANPKPEDDGSEKKRGAEIGLARPFTMDDPLWELFGFVADPEAPDLSRNKKPYVARAYMPKRDTA